MSDLTQEQKDHLATEAMKWVRWGDYWGDPNIPGSGQFTVHTWTPDQNIQQAMMLLEKFDGWEIQKWENGQYRILVATLDEESGLLLRPDEVMNESLPLAICQAVLAATRNDDG